MRSGLTVHDWCAQRRLGIKKLSGWRVKVLSRERGVEPLAEQEWLRWNARRVPPASIVVAATEDPAHLVAWASGWSAVVAS